MYEDPEATPEQNAAFRNLDEAISAYHAAHDLSGLVMDWVLVTSITDPLADGRDAVATSYIGSSGQPRYRSLGLLEYASTVVRKEIANDVF